MANEPCSICEMPYTGASRRTYFSWYVDEEPISYMVVACKSCSEDLRSSALIYGFKKVDGKWQKVLPLPSTVMQLEAPERALEPPPGRPKRTDR